MRKVPQLPSPRKRKFDRKSPTSGLTFRIGNGRQQRHFGAARIEPRVLHDDRNVRFEHRGVVGVARDRLRVVEIVEAQMQCTPGGDGHVVGPTGSRLTKKMVMATRASCSLALRMQAVSWEMSARS